MIEKWLKSCISAKDVKQRFAIQQFFTSLPGSGYEREPKMCAKAEELAHTFVQARKPQAEVPLRGVNRKPKI